MMADARSLFWPWCIVAAAGILSLFHLRLPGGMDLEEVAGFGFAVGFPLLAALSFGNEFQFGTLSSLLSQPIERSAIWIEKSAVIVIAVLSAAVAYGFGAHRMGWGMRDITAAALWLMVTVSSSAYWTLIARSAIGGLVLIGGQAMALVLVFGPLLNRLEVHAAGPGLLGLGGFAAAYTAVMLYLGRRKLLRFQVTASGSGSNVLATEWAVAPNSLRRLLRCTASGGTLNLLRKELHLLWPLAPLTLIALGILLAVVPLRFLSGDHGWFLTFGISVVLIHGSLTAILAGTLSLGEERSLGLHAWSLTQPVSVRRQWAIKVVTVVFASAACSGAVVLMTHLLFGPDFLQQFAVMFYGSLGISSLAIFPILTFVAFWCATGMNGTVRAAFWCLPAAAAVLVAYGFGFSTGMGNSAVEVVRTLTQAVHPFPFSSEFEVMSSNLMWSPGRVVVPALWVTGWLLPFAAIQSYRLFRSEIREGIRPMIRQVLVLAAIGFLSGVLQIVPAAATRTMHQNTRRALAEISRGVAAMQIDPRAVSEFGHTVPVATLMNLVALSDLSRAWLATDTLVIRPMTPLARFHIPELDEARYLITAEIHGGWKCAFADNLFEVERKDSRASNYLFVCKSKQGTLGWLKADP
jgi:hypothetical protein